MTVNSGVSVNTFTVTGTSSYKKLDWKLYVREQVTYLVYIFMIVTNKEVRWFNLPADKNNNRKLNKSPTPFLHIFVSAKNCITKSVYSPDFIPDLGQHWRS